MGITTFALLMRNKALLQAAESGGHYAAWSNRGPVRWYVSHSPSSATGKSCWQRSPWIAEHNTASLGGLQSVFSALCNHFAFVLCDGGQDVNRELVGVGIIELRNDQSDQQTNRPS
jgi:hypothetical protein